MWAICGDNSMLTPSSGAGTYYRPLQHHSGGGEGLVLELENLPSSVDSDGTKAFCCNWMFDLFRGRHNPYKTISPKELCLLRLHGE